jgi:hypothetical protein
MDDERSTDERASRIALARAAGARSNVPDAVWHGEYVTAAHSPFSVVRNGGNQLTTNPGKSINTK